MCELLGRAAEPFLVQVIPEVFQRYGDKDRAVQFAAEDALETIVARLNPYGVVSLVPMLLSALRPRERMELKVGVL